MARRKWPGPDLWRAGRQPAGALPRGTPTPHVSPPRGGTTGAASAGTPETVSDGGCRMSGVPLREGGLRGRVSAHRRHTVTAFSSGNSNAHGCRSRPCPADSIYGLEVAGDGRHVAIAGRDRT